MRRVLAGAVVAVMLLGVAAFGADGLSFGVLGGLNSSRFEFNYSETPGLFDPDARLGLRLGGFAEYQVSELFSMQLGVDYNERGYAYDVTMTSEQGAELGEKTFSPYLSYVSIPLMLKWRPDFGRVDLFVVGGPRFDIKVGHSDDLDWNQFYEFFKDTQWGMTIGGGAEVAVSPRLSVIFGVLYNFDFEDAYEYENLVTIKRESLDFVTGIRF